MFVCLFLCLDEGPQIRVQPGSTSRHNKAWAFPTMMTDKKIPNNISAAAHSALRMSFNYSVAVGGRLFCRPI
jgi:hypothetical protein